MKKPFVLFVLLISLASCGGEKKAESSEPITEDVKKELKEAEDANVELEQLDGEVDSLLNTI